MAQLVALMSGVVLGGVAEVVGSNLARGKIFTASIGSVDSLYPISLAISNVSHLFCAHLRAVPINFNCNDENRILGKRNHEFSDVIL